MLDKGHTQKIWIRLVCLRQIAWKPTLDFYAWISVDAYRRESPVYLQMPIGTHFHNSYSYYCFKSTFIK